MKDTAIIRHKSIQIKGKTQVFNRCLTMGILNLTDDSFYSGSRVNSEKNLLEKAAQMRKEGVDIFDLGAYSTRPGAQEVPEDLEKERMIKAVNLLVREFPDIPISADTFRAEVVRAAIGEGADIINDVSGGRLDEKMFQTVADLKVPYILMHSKGTPENMQKLTDYTDVVNEVIFDLAHKISELRLLGLNDIIVDPGFGFAKTIDQNFCMLARLEEFAILDAPLLIGISRKSTIYKTLNTKPEDSLNGTTALHTAALLKGADILRVHDVMEAREVIELIENLNLNNQINLPF